MIAQKLSMRRQDNPLAFRVGKRRREEVLEKKEKSLLQKAAFELFKEI